MTLPPERRGKKVLFTGGLKASLVLLSATSAECRRGESRQRAADDTNKTDPSRRETNKRKKRQWGGGLGGGEGKQSSDSGQRAAVSTPVSLFFSYEMCTGKLNMMPA